MKRNFEFKKVENTNWGAEYSCEINNEVYSVAINTDAIEEMNWTWESLVFAGEEETIAVVENENTGEKTYICTSGEVNIFRLTEDEDSVRMSNEEIKEVALNGDIYNESKYYVDNNNWFAIEFRDKDMEFLDDYVFDYVSESQDIRILCTELLNSHLDYFEKQRA